MKKLVMIVLAALMLVGFFGLAKIQTWSAVGKDALVEKIDHALGEFDVKRTEAAGGVEGLQKTLRVVREGQIRSEVKSEQLDAKLIAVRDRKDQMQSALQKIRDQVASGETLVLGGKTYEGAEMNTLAQKMIAIFESLETKESSIVKAKHLLDTNAANMQAKVEQGQQKIVLMNNQLEEIDAKILALSTMRDAAQSSVGHASDLAEAFEEVADQLDHLYAEVETGLRMEESAWQDAGLAHDVEIEKFVQSTQGQDETMAKIDAILGH